MTSSSLSPLCRGLGAATVLAFLALVPGTATSAVPDCGQSTIPRILVGNATGNFLPPPNGYVVVVRDIAGFVVPGARVTLSFGDTPVALVRLQSVQNAGTVVNCATRDISQMANAAGEARFGARLGGYQPAPTIDVVLDGILCPDRVVSRSTDLVQAAPATTGLADFNAFAACYTNPLCQCTAGADEFDYDLDFQGACLGDFALFATEFLSLVVGPYCP